MLDKVSVDAELIAHAERLDAHAPLARTATTARPMISDPPRVRRHLARLPGYAPVVPLAERARIAGLEPEDCLKLDANENPYGMHAQVREALRQALANPNFGSTYPDPNQSELRAALSRYTGLDASMIIAGAGADELLDLALRALLPPGGSVITCSPSFGMYPFSRRCQRPQPDRRTSK